MTTHDHTALEKTSHIPLSPVGSESEKPTQENFENIIASSRHDGSDEESQQQEFKVSSDPLILNLLAPNVDPVMSHRDLD